MLTVNNVEYKDEQTKSTKRKSFGRKKTTITRTMSYNETVVRSELNANNIVLNSSKGVLPECPKVVSS